MCNLIYTLMTDGKSRAEVATFEALIADPSEKEKMLARQNQLAQQQLAQYGFRPPPRAPKNGRPH